MKYDVTKFSNIFPLELCFQELSEPSYGNVISSSHSVAILPAFAIDLQCNNFDQLVHNFAFCPLPMYLFVYFMVLNRKPYIICLLVRFAPKAVNKIESLPIPHECEEWAHEFVVSTKSQLSRSGSVTVWSQTGAPVTVWS